MKRTLKNSIAIIYLFLTAIIGSVILVLNSTIIYKLSIPMLKIMDKVTIPREKVIEDYTRVINYIRNPFIEKLNLENFKMSGEGEIHFYEVKEIIVSLEIIFIMLIVIGIIIFLLNKRKVIKFPIESFKYTFNFTLIAFTSLLIAFYVDFNYIFNKFHGIFFNNNYWIFDPKKDPIINVLPESYFMLCAVVVILFTIIITLILRTIYKKIK